MERLEAVEHIRPMRGGAQSHLLRAGDGNFYVVKFQNNPQHRRVLANELMAARLARHLGLPVPVCALIDSTPLAGAPGLVMRIGGQMQPCAPGLQFGSRLPTADPQTPIYDFLPDAGLELVANLGDFAGMLAFDKWTCNCNGRQVVFCRPHPRQRLRVYMIDQGFCFNAGDWNFPDSPLRGVYGRNIVYQGVTGWDSFQPWLEKIESVPAELLEAVAEEIPPEWYGDSNDLEALLWRLFARREQVRELISAVWRSARAPFPAWRDDAAAAAPAGSGDGPPA